MQPGPFTYDELTPLEQCIADFMARQQSLTHKRQKEKKRTRDYADA